MQIEDEYSDSVEAIVSYSGVRHAAAGDSLDVRRYPGEHTTLCNFHWPVDQSPFEATSNCVFCVAGIRWGSVIREMYFNRLNEVDPRERHKIKLTVEAVARACGASEQEISYAVAGAPYLYWCDPYHNSTRIGVKALLVPKAVQDAVAPKPAFG